MQIPIYHILYEFLFATAIMGPFMQLCTGGAGVIRFLMFFRALSIRGHGATVPARLERNPKGHFS